MTAAFCDVARIGNSAMGSHSPRSGNNKRTQQRVAALIYNIISAAFGRFVKRPFYMSQRLELLKDGNWCKNIN